MTPDVTCAGNNLFVMSEGGGPDLILLHGGVGSWNHWTRNIEGLSRHFTVRAFDLPGFGESPTFLPDLDDDMYFRWVAQAAMSMSDGPIFLAGFSFGGSIAAGISKYLGARLSALTLVAPGSFGAPLERKLDVRSIRNAAHVENAHEAARHNLNQIMFVNPALSDDATVAAHLHNIERARFNSRRISWQDRLEADLESVQCPIQMIWGAEDRVAYPSVAARVARCGQFRSTISFSVVPDAGHWVQYEQPAEFARVLLDFLLNAKARSIAIRSDAAS
jgi:2-hydroxy-6-oxonona-2,4-dienedioate hydrolase